MLPEKKGIFKKQVEFKPFHYPHLLEFRKAIKSTPWHAEEYDYASDIQDFKVNLSEKEREVAKRAMLAISQIEASGVKHFWGDIGKLFPRPEVAMVGYTFAENEVVHSEAYSMILDILGYNEAFKDVLKTDVIGGRVDYLEKYLKGSGDNTLEFSTLKVALFSLFIENVSLFSQFYILRSFKEHENRLKAIDNVVQATMKDELVHAQFGIEIIKLIKEDNPEWFDEEFYNKIKRACKKAYEAESKIVDWIFEFGDLKFVTREEVREFLKKRFNESLVDIGCEPVFNNLDKDLLSKSEWLSVEIYAYVRNDFFNNKSVLYNKKNIKVEDIKSGIKLFKEEFGYAE